MVDGSKLESLKWEGAGAGATDFTEHIDTLLQGIAAGLGVPKDILVGVSAGAITGSDINQKSSFKEIGEIQRDMEILFRELGGRMGYDMENVFFEWAARFAHDEEERSKIDLNRAQELAIRSGWLTINEIREIEGLPPIPEGESMVADFTIQANMGQTADEQEATKNPQGANT